VDNGLLSTGIGPTRVAAPANFTTMIAMVARHPNAALLRALNAGPKRFNELLAEVQSVPELAVSGCLRDLDSERPQDGAAAAQAAGRDRSQPDA